MAAGSDGASKRRAANLPNAPRRTPDPLGSKGATQHPTTAAPVDAAAGRAGLGCGVVGFGLPSRRRSIDLRHVSCYSTRLFAARVLRTPPCSICPMRRTGNPGFHAALHTEDIHHRSTCGDQGPLYWSPGVYRCSRISAVRILRGSW